MHIVKYKKEKVLSINIKGKITYKAKYYISDLEKIDDIIEIIQNDKILRKIEANYFNKVKKINELLSKNYTKAYPYDLISFLKLAVEEDGDFTINIKDLKISKEEEKITFEKADMEYEVFIEDLKEYLDSQMHRMHRIRRGQNPSSYLTDQYAVGGEHLSPPSFANYFSEKASYNDKNEIKEFLKDIESNYLFFN